jgi:hypothetical protein
VSFITFPSYFTIQQGNLSIVGNTAGNQSTGANDFLAGQNAGNHSTASDLIVIGVNALSAGVTDANANGTIAIGVNAGAAMTNFTSSNPGPDVLIGTNVLPDAPRMPTTVAIGYDIMPTFSQSTGNLGDNVIIGILACGNVNSVQSNMIDNVIIGYKAYQTGNAAATQDINECVIIGSEACQNGGPDGSGTTSACVFIGYDCAGSLGANVSNHVVIGSTAGVSLTGSTIGHTLIGFQVQCTGAGNYNTLLGANSSLNGSANATLLGANINISSSYSVSGSVIIGAGAGSDLTSTATASNMLLIETNPAGTVHRILYGSITNGNLAIGNKPTDFDFGGSGATNVLKLYTGTAGGTAPTNGGYFYYSGTVLYFIGVSGVAVPVATT